MQASRQTRRQTKRHPQDLPPHTHSHFQLKLHPTSAETYGHTYIHIHSNSYIIDVYIYICIHIPEAESLACLALPCVTRHGACGRGWQVLKAIFGFVSGGGWRWFWNEQGSRRTIQMPFKGGAESWWLYQLLSSPLLQDCWRALTLDALLESRPWIPFSRGLRSIKRSFAIHRTGHHYHDLRSGCRHRPPFLPSWKFCVGLLGRQRSRDLRWLYLLPGCYRTSTGYQHGHDALGSHHCGRLSGLFVCTTQAPGRTGHGRFQFAITIGIRLLSFFHLSWKTSRSLMVAGAGPSQLRLYLEPC